MNRQSLRTAASLLLAAMLPGCCGIYAAWCGPDRSEWVQVGYATPEEAVATVLEAIRRGNADVLFQSTSPSLRRRLGIQDRLTMRSVWARLEDEVSGLNALGDGDPGAPAWVGPERVTFDVSVLGERIPLTFHRMPWHWRIAAEFEMNGRRILERDDGNSPAPITQQVQPEEAIDGEATLVRLPPIGTGIYLDGVEQIQKVEFVREWRLDDLPLPEADGGAAPSR